MKIRTSLLLSSAVFFSALTGCATRGDIELMRGEISELQRTADLALKNSVASTELSRSNQSGLASVLALAESNTLLARQNSENMEKMFQQIMQK